MGLLPLLAAAVLTSVATPSVSFTNDSVYKKDVVNMSVVLEEDESKTLLIEEKNLLGYCIYDDLDTPYIDGLRFDEELVYDWKVPNYDESIEHTLHVKTVYTDDIAGMLAKAKAGDFSALLSNPLMIIQMVYYILAGIAVVLGGFGLAKSRKGKIKDHNQIAASVTTAADNSFNALSNVVGVVVEDILVPIVGKIQEQNNGILEALILSRGDDAESKLAMVDLLKKAATGFDPNQLVTETKARIQKALDEAKKAKEEVMSDVHKIATGEGEEDKGSSGNNYGGISV